MTLRKSKHIEDKIIKTVLYDDQNKFNEVNISIIFLD